MSVAELSQAVDRCVDEFDKAQLADEYTPGASMPWLVTLERRRLRDAR